MNKLIQYSILSFIGLFFTSNSLFARVNNSFLFTNSVNIEISKGNINSIEIENHYNDFLSVLNSGIEFFSIKEFIINFEEENTEINRVIKKLDNSISKLTFANLQSNYTSINSKINSFVFSFYKEFFYLSMYNSLYIFFGVFRI